MRYKCRLLVENERIFFIEQSLHLLYPINIWFIEHKRPLCLTVKVCKIKRQQPSYLGYPL